MIGLRTLFRSTMAYSINTLVGPLFTIVLTPIYARVLTQADYGALETIEALGTVLLTIGMLGLRTALGVFLRDQPDEQTRLRLISTVMTLAAGCAALLAAAALLEVLAYVATEATLVGAEITAAASGFAQVAADAIAPLLA